MTDEIHLFKTNAYFSAGEPNSVLLFKTNAYVSSKGNPFVRLYYDITQVAETNFGSLRLGFLAEEQVMTATSHLRLTNLFIQDIIDTASKLRLANMITQVIIPVLPEPPMSNLPLPGFGNDPINPTVPAAANPAKTALPGLTFDVHKIPAFKTNIKEAAAGNEVRNSLMEMPRWDFELEYEYLRDIPRDTGQSSLHVLMGFFMQMRGAYDTFLFKDPDDYLVTVNALGIGDGVTPEYGFLRNMGGFNELIGQVDVDNAIDIYLTPHEAHTVPAMAAYTITVPHFPIAENVQVKVDAGAVLTKVSGAPAAGQYQVNLGTGVYTFNAAQASSAIHIDYRYLVDPSDYILNLPNHFQFDTAPPLNAVVSASFQFFFACRFVEDTLDFAKFMDKLWNLQACNFRSVIQ